MNDEQWNDAERTYVQRMHRERRVVIVGILVTILFIGGTGYFTYTRNTDRARYCRAGTVYVAVAEACMAGSRPWEEK